jgi:glycerophosphoryl diester phosphodiesterase
MHVRSKKTRAAPGSLVVGFLAVLCAGYGGPALAQTASGPKPFPTLNGEAPLVIGHRGLPGLMPEETLPSYDMAAALGTDAFEEDLHLSKDCVLVARHNPWLSDNTNVAEVAKSDPEVAARKRTVPGVRVKVTWAATPAAGPPTTSST